jgi:hypothetical protein
MNHSFTYSMLYLFQFFIHYGSHKEVKGMHMAAVALLIMLLPAAFPWPGQKGGRDYIQVVTSEMWV